MAGARGAARLAAGTRPGRGIVFTVLVAAAAAALCAPALGQRADADALRDAGRYGEAAAKYEEVLASAPDDAAAHFGLGFCRMVLGQSEEGTDTLEKGLAALGRAAELSPDTASYRFYRGYCALVLSGKTTGDPARRTRWLSLAADEVQAALDRETNPGVQATYKGTLARILKDKSDFPRARALFRDALAAAPEKWNWFFLGEVERALGNEPAAVEAFLEALKLDSQFLNPLTPLSEIFKRLREVDKNYRGAAELLEKIVALKPHPFHHSWALKELADNRFDLGDLEGGIRALEEAERVAPTEANFPNRLGLAYLATGESDKGIEAFRRAVSLNPLLLYPYENLGTELAARGRAREAWETFRDGWLSAAEVAKTAAQPDIRAEAEYYRFLYRLYLDQLAAHR